MDQIQRFSTEVRALQPTEQHVFQQHMVDIPDSNQKENGSISCSVALTIQLWGDMLFLLGTGLALALLYWLATPYQRTVFIYDATISNKDEGQSTIPSWACFVVPFVLLLLSVGVVELLLGRRMEHRDSTMALATCLHFILQGIYAYIFVILLCQITNFIVGYPRPDFLTRCQPADTSFPTAFSTTPNAILCTNTNTALVEDGRKSFPSGHSASSAVMTTFITIYLLWGLYTRKRNRALKLQNRWHFFLWDVLHTIALLYLCALWAWTWFVGASRIIDNEHSPADVTAGWVLGIIIGALFGCRAILRSRALVIDLASLRYA